MIRILLLIEAIFGGYFLAAVLPSSFFGGRSPV